MFPSRSTSASSGGGCQPIGRSTALWGTGKTFPYSGEDGAILLWRRRDCCMTSGVNDLASSATAIRAGNLSTVSEGIMRARASKLSDQTENRIRHYSD